MKKVLILGLLLFSIKLSFTQTNIYLLTEKYTLLKDFSIDSVFVTDPAGNVVSYSIPHQGIDIPGHDSELSKIINSITQKGYTIVDFDIWQLGNTTFEGKNTNVRTIFFKEP